jgi:hypothetical protein
MPKKKPTWLDKKIADIEQWGVLSIFQHLKDKWENEMTRQRNIIFSMGTDNYKGTNLETHDRYVDAVRIAFNREFRKVYDGIKDERDKTVHLIEESDRTPPPPR